MDPITSVGAGLAVLGSKDLLVKILGPSADYLGGEIQGLVQKCNINLDNIFTKAIVKLGTRLESTGQVNSRVLKHIIDEGRFCEDELTAEYYGGILASSKTDTGRDDRGIAIVSTINVLSTYQIRSHYLFYYLFHQFYSNVSVSLGTDRHKLKIYIPGSVYGAAMDFSSDEDSAKILAHCVGGLARHGLIHENYIIGSQEFIKKHYKDAPEQGLIVAPTVEGAEVFLWGLGRQGATGYELTEGLVEIEPPMIQITDGTVALYV